MNDIKYPPGCKDIQSEIATEELIRRLKKIQLAYQNIDQNAKENEKYKDLAILLGSDIFLQHEHADVQLLIACCLADIFRIFAPQSPYEDPTNLKNIFLFLANQLKGLKDNANTSFKRYFYLLENLECVKTFQLCLDLDECQEIIAALFESAFKIINSQTTPKVKNLLFDLLHPLLNESEQISTKVLDTLFTRIIEPQKSNNKEAYNLAVSLLKKGNEQFEYVVQNHLNNILLTNRNNIGNNLTINQSFNQNNTKGSNDSGSLNNSLNESATTPTSNQFISDKLCLIIYEINQIRPSFLELLMPQLEFKLKSSDLKERREYTKLLSKMFSEKDSRLANRVPQLWEAYLERFADMNEDIRKICIQNICDFLIQQSRALKTIDQHDHQQEIQDNNLNQEQQESHHILEQIMEQIKNRSLDSDESLRFEVLQEILKAIKSDSNLITLDLLNILKERTLDIKIKVRKLALQGLATLYKKIHAKSTQSRKTIQTVNWIPNKVMRIYFQESSDDKLLVERLLNSSIVPYSLGAREKMAQLYYAFTQFDQFSIMSLVEIMKNRVLLYQLMRSILDQVELMSTTTAGSTATITKSIKQSASSTTIQASKSITAINEAKLNADVMLISQNLLDTTKGHEFMTKLIELLKKNHNLRNYFKNFVQLSCSCSKSMQLIQMIFTNMPSLNQTQMGMAKRLIERMSSLIIDCECFESLIDLVENKIRQKLTMKQRKMLKQTSDNENKKAKKSNKNNKKYSQESSSEDYDEEDESEQENEIESLIDEDDEIDEDEETIATNDDSEENEAETNREKAENIRALVKHIDDDGDKGLQLISMILMIHNSSYGFANVKTYQKLFSFINSRKDHVVSHVLRILSQHYSHLKADASLIKINDLYLDKLKHFCLNGKPKQAKNSIHLIYNNYERAKSDEILLSLYDDLIKEAAKKQTKNFITCLISLGHIAYLIPHLVGKEMKDFVHQTLVKEILFVPMQQQLSHFSLSGDDSINNGLAAKRKNNLKLAGKWCENEDELPFQTRCRIESIKLLIRWCLGLKNECPSAGNTIRTLVKLIRENTVSSAIKNEDEKEEVVVSDAERSRIRAVCAAQLIKMAQEPLFRQHITAEYFHVLAKLILDPVTNVRDIMIKKLQKPLKSNKLSINYMAIFALTGFDGNRERKSKVKKIYSQLVKQIRLQDQKAQQRHQMKNKSDEAGNQNSIQTPTRILPEMCLSFAVSLLAHNIKIDSLKDEAKVKQIKECMSVILDPLIENPDSYQIAYIKKILNKIKISDDGMAAAAVSASNSSSEKSNHPAALQNLYLLNKNLCFICEIFLFHLHSKSTSYLSNKDYQFDIKLPSGFFSPRDISNSNSNASSQQQQLLDKEIEENLKDANQSLDKIIGNSENEEEDENETIEKETIEIESPDGKKKKTITIAKSTKSTSRIEIVHTSKNNNSKKRKAQQVVSDLNEDEEKENEDEEENDHIETSKLSNKKLSHESNNDDEASKSHTTSSPPSKRNRLSGSSNNNSKANEPTSVNKSTRGRKKPGKELEEEKSESEEDEEHASTSIRGRRSTKTVQQATDKKNEPETSNKTPARKGRAKKEEQEENNKPSLKDSHESEESSSFLADEVSSTKRSLRQRTAKK